MADLNAYRLNGTQLQSAKGPFGYEFVPGRAEGEQWRISDANDNAVGSAATEEGARTAIRRLRGGGAA